MERIISNGLRVRTRKSNQRTLRGAIGREPENGAPAYCSLEVGVASTRQVAPFCSSAIVAWWFLLALPPREVADAPAIPRSCLVSLLLGNALHACTSSCIQPLRRKPQNSVLGNLGVM
jgi:hypothetical protein